MSFRDYACNSIFLCLKMDINRGGERWRKSKEKKDVCSLEARVASHVNCYKEYILLWWLTVLSHLVCVIRLHNSLVFFKSCVDKHLQRVCVAHTQEMIDEVWCLTKVSLSLGIFVGEFHSWFSFLDLEYLNIDSHIATLSLLALFLVWSLLSRIADGRVIFEAKGWARNIRYDSLRL